MHHVPDPRAPRVGTALLALLLGMLLVGFSFGVLGVAPPRPSGSSRAQTVATYAALGVSLSYSPNPVNVNSPTNVMYSITGGTGPYTIWVNGTPSGCYPPSNPFTTSNASDSKTCYPSSTGSFPVHVDVHDSAGNRGSASTTLSVNSNSGNTGGSGSGGNGSGGFSLPQDLITMVFTVTILFLVGLFALAGGVIAMAVLVSRRLRQLGEAMRGAPPKPPKEP